VLVLTGRGPALWAGQFRGGSVSPISSCGTSSASFHHELPLQFIAGFKKRHWALDIYLNWMLCPFFGQTPGTFCASHGDDHRRQPAARLSSTMAISGYSLSISALLPALRLSDPIRARSPWRAGNTKLLPLSPASELLRESWRLAVESKTLVVFVFPFVFVRLMMMVGNCVQHAFIDPDHPDDPTRAASTRSSHGSTRGVQRRLSHLPSREEDALQRACDRVRAESSSTAARMVTFDGIELAGI
jgi:hypothetical protein